jgi:chromosome segregation ATPase
MARKSLSDLLKQEVKAQSQPELNAGISPVPESTPEASVPEPTADLLQLKAQLDSIKAALQAEKSQGQKLKEQLQQEKKAQEKVKQLEQSLKQEQARVKELQNEVQLVEKLQTELKEEKNLVGKLYSKIQDLEEDLAPPVSTAITIFPRAMPARYVAPKQPPTNLSDEDIGWFD